MDAFFKTLHCFLERMPALYLPLATGPDLVLVTCRDQGSVLNRH